MSKAKLQRLANEVRRCTLCTEQLELGPRPILQVSTKAKILIAGQAPGTKVHATGIPFNDPSGDRLREWMGIDRDVFYDPDQIALLPMGFCYPGKGKSGDLPPIPLCAETWRSKLLGLMPQIELTLVVGQYAIGWHVEQPAKTLTATVQNWRDQGDRLLPLPHPSPRNNIWLKKNPWFEAEVVPHLRSRVAHLLAAN